MNTRFLFTHFRRAALFLGSLGALGLAAHAESPIAKVSVPFEFAAGGAMMPPGEYTVDVPDFSGVVVLRGPAGNSVALLTTFTPASAGRTTAKLIFERRDGMLYLAAIESPSESAQVMSVFKHVTKGAVAAALR
jgi:hypothetical protein